MKSSKLEKIFSDFNGMFKEALLDSYLVGFTDGTDSKKPEGKKRFELKAEIISAEEALFPNTTGDYLVILVQYFESKNTGKDFVIFQGTKNACNFFCENLNDALKYLEVD